MCVSMTPLPFLGLKSTELMIYTKDGVIQVERRLRGSDSNSASDFDSVWEFFTYVHAGRVGFHSPPTSPLIILLMINTVLR